MKEIRKLFLRKIAIAFLTDKVHTLEGTGLGLSIVRNIIEKHHSVVNIKSEVGVGSTFWFDLSVYQDRCELPNADGVENAESLEVALVS